MHQGKILQKLDGPNNRGTVSYVELVEQWMFLQLPEVCKMELYNIGFMHS